jgi:hypothetical protein
MIARMGSCHRRESPSSFTHHLQARESVVAASICVLVMTMWTNVRSDNRPHPGIHKATIAGDRSLALVRSLNQIPSEIHTNRYEQMVTLRLLQDLIFATVKPSKMLQKTSS